MSLFDDSVEFWSSINLSIRKVPSPFLDRYLALLRERYSNGTVIQNVFSFQFFKNSEEFVDEKLYSYLVKQKLFQKSEVISAFENYELHSDYYKSFAELHAYELPGLLAIILQAGGAYSPLKFDMANYELAFNAAVEVANGDLNNAKILYSGSAWSSFFYDVAWDHTIVVYLPAGNTINIIMATDVD